MECVIFISALQVPVFPMKENVIIILNHGELRDISMN